VSAAPQLSIVIPVYNNWWLTERCLSALEALRLQTPVSFETIVVDNASSDETAIAVSEFDSVLYLRNDENRNFAGACNDGAALASAPLVLFLNNDAYPLGDALAPMVRVFDRADVFVAGGALFYEDGVTQAAGLVVLPNGHWHHFCRNLPASLPEVRRSRDALAVGGAAMAVRRKWFLDSGGFDESFVNGFEDVDLCLRARAEKRPIAYVAEAAFAHYEAASEGRFAREQDNERRFYEHWSASMADLPRVARGDVGAIVMRTRVEDPLLRAAREDLEEGLRSFGHPIAHHAIAPWRRLDPRFRSAASIGWFAETSAPGVIVSRDAELPALRANGEVSVSVPWLPCASPARIERIAVRRSPHERCTTIAVCGAQDAISAEFEMVRITPEMLLRKNDAIDVACIVHFGFTDDAAFGNVVLAQAGIPAIALDLPELRAIFAHDVAVFSDVSCVAAAARRFVDDARLREHYGARLAADARRRFSPRRAAMRVVDLLCAARFGLERPGEAITNSPLRT
jgi:GT2 family glycosyltransferase